MTTETEHLKSAVKLRETGDRKITCTTQDFHNFFMSEQEAVAACLRARLEKFDLLEIQDAFELTLRRIASWCLYSSKAARCVIAPRSEDLIVVLCANDEDEDGSLHDQMIDMELDFFDSTKFNVTFMMLRKSEYEGMGAFADPDRSRTIYRAE